MIYLVLAAAFIVLALLDRAARIRESREHAFQMAALEESIRIDVLAEIENSRAERGAQDAELVEWLVRWTTATRKDLADMQEVTEEFRELVMTQTISGGEDSN